MKTHLLALGVAFSFVISPVAAEPRLLQTGDVIDLGDDDYMDRMEFRAILLDYGYTRIGTGGRYGSIQVITAQGYDKNRYEIKVNSRTGEVVRVQAVRRLYST